MKLLVKISVPIVILLIITISAVTGISYYFETILLNASMSELTDSKVEEAAGIIELYQNEVDKVKTELNNQYAERARTLSFIIERDPTLAESAEGLNKLLEVLDLDEINICDEKGIVSWSTNSELIGTDFNNSEQTKAFLGAISDKDFYLTREPVVDGAMGELLQYIGIARQDKPGIIQITVKSRKLQTEMAKSDIRSIPKSIAVGKDGYVAIIDKNSDIIITHKNYKLIGKKSTDIGIGKGIREKDKGGFFLEMNGVREYLSYMSSGAYIIVAAIPAGEYTGGLSKLLINIILVAGAALVLCFIVIFLLLDFNVIRELKKILKVLQDIGKGNLTGRLSIKSSLELSALSNGINTMSDNLKTLVNKNLSVVSSLKDLSGKLEASADQTGKSA
ncbi:MAG TPA: methyl-accepting chemotaxis protein [Clostridia bacterium]|nr:methyl-accepting chemotaxis protein [Clostridia bacterium]